MITIGFHNPQLCVRGSSVALYDYAHYNETILNNRSIILVPSTGVNDPNALIKFITRFRVIFYNNMDHMDKIITEEGISIFYAIKYGTFDGIVAKNIKNIIHCVFDLSQPHGDVYAAVSHALAKKFNSNTFVPHMIGLKPSRFKENMRKTLGIPEDAVVFGRHGGMDTFNLKFCHDIINQITLHKPNIYFVFVNTPNFSSHQNVIFLDKIVNLDEKNRFINTCDAHLECGTLGHTFGISCGEFSVNNKPIIVYKGNVWNTAHYDILGDKALYFRNPQEFYDILTTFNPRDWESKDNNCYRDYTPQKVMKIFKEVFLDPCIK